MIVYGWKGSHIKSGQIINTNCTQCETNTSMIYSIFGQYAHIYWIPLFPYKKKTFVECSNCKKTFDKYTFTDEIKSKIKRENEKNGNSRYPFWMFSGVIIIAGLIGYSYLNDILVDNEEDKLIKDPKIGDIYHVRLFNGHFSSFRIDKVQRDNLDITLNDYETDLMSSVDEINISENFTNQKINISPLRLYSLYKQDTIYTIERKK